MLMKPEPLAAAIESVKQLNADATGSFNNTAGQTSPIHWPRSFPQTGTDYPLRRYEGVDERIHQHYVDHEISIGDYVLSGGELAAMVLVDSVTR